MGRKLLLHDKVEVRQLEEGLGGSWHPGTVVEVLDSCRRVEYDELLCETGNSTLIESIPVSESIEGLYQRPYGKSNYRGRIRPRPPLPHDANPRFSFGVCVDVLFKEAWWEGVMFDYDESAKERYVFFPDEGDERKFKVTDLRVTLEWDEFSASWRERGVWVLVNLAREHKKDGHVFQLVKRVWSHLKVHYGFMKMISEWTCGAYCLWKEYFSEVVCDFTVKERPPTLSFATSKIQVVSKRGRKPKRSKRSYLNASVLTRSMLKRKEKEFGLAVRTRRMCLTESDPVVSVTCQGIIPADDQYNHSQLVTADACTNSRVLKTDENHKHDQSICYRQISEGVPVKEGSHCWSSPRNDSIPTTSSCILENQLKMPQNNNFRRKCRLVAKKSTPTRKMKHSKINSPELERHSCISSQITREVDDGITLQVQGSESVEKRKELISQKENKGVLAMRFPSLRRRRRVKISKRSIRKRRIPLRIKKIVPRKIEKSNAKSMSLQGELESSLPIHKENDPLDSHRQGVPPVTASCQQHRAEASLCSSKKQRGKRGRCCDSVCFVCQYGGELLHCEHCMSSYHLNCIDLKEVPVGESICPSCRCGLCGMNYAITDDQLFTQVCYQCGRLYHVGCLTKAGILVSGDTCLDKFCSKNCFEICSRLHELLQISNPTAMEGLSWTVTRSRRNDCNVHNERVHPLIQVSQVLNVFHECFEPILEPHTGRDLVTDIVYNSGSKFRRLDFHGFYVIALIYGEELVCAATIRIHGQKVAEMPLIATCFKYRRKGMCRLLVDELEKVLVEMGVERLVLPAIAQLSETWVSSFGFTEMSALVRKEFLEYPFVVFQGTRMFQKILIRSKGADTSKGSQKPEEDSKLPRENKAGCVLSKKFCLRYQRRRKPEAPGKGEKATDGSDMNQSACKFVYKRRRIQASRDTRDNL